MTLQPSVRAFATALIDYAGLFPPARLALDPALENFARYQRGPERWMLARFVLPAARLGELDEGRLAPFEAGNPLRLSLLGTAQEHGAAIGRIVGEQGARLVAEALETRLPEGDFRDFLAAEAHALDQAGLPLRPFYELPWDEAWDERLPGAIEGLAMHNARHGAQAGFKLRCGGESPETIPTPTQVARALLLCRDAGVPMKFTAGLHHPVRHFDATVGATMHGFFNVFIGGMLAHAHGLGPETLVAILEEQDAAGFQFDEEAIAWHSLRIDISTINNLRENQLLSYGSCSFAEPRDDLQSLGLLPTIGERRNVFP